MSDHARTDPAPRKGMTASEIDTAIDSILDEATLEEKVAMMSGRGFFAQFKTSGGHWGAEPYRAGGGGERLGVPALYFTDGPRGVARGSSTCFPVSMARGASWDRDLERRIGEVMGIEARSQGCNLSGAVCVNLLRHPGGGRAQETYGEDPYHVGEMGAALARGLQTHNVIATVKHFTLNSIENARFKLDVRIDERTLREVYLPHFKRILDAGCASVMSAYNEMNGEHCGQNRILLTDILRHEWGFEGFVHSDWVMGVYAPYGASAGLDVENPEPIQFGKKLVEAVECGQIEPAVVNTACPPDPLDAVSLRRRRRSPPRVHDGSRGPPRARGPRPGGGREVRGAAVEPGRPAAAEERAHRGPRAARGGREHRRRGLQPRAASPRGHGPRRIEEVPRPAGSRSRRRRVGSGGGRTGGRRSRCGDRDRGPHGRRGRRVHSRRDGVRRGGGGWALHRWPRGGRGEGDVRFAEAAVDRGRSCLTAAPGAAGAADRERERGESPDRGRDRGRVGGADTRFGYRALELRRTPTGLEAQVSIRNEGERERDEMARLYVGFPGRSVERPRKLLRGFERVSLRPGEMRTVDFRIPDADLAYWSPTSRSWEREPSEHRIWVGSSSRDEDLLSASISI